jgi:hypothetical protein
VKPLSARIAAPARSSSLDTNVLNRIFHYCHTSEKLEESLLPHARHAASQGTLEEKYGETVKNL